MYGRRPDRLKQRAGHKEPGTDSDGTARDGLLEGERLRKAKDAEMDENWRKMGNLCEVRWQGVRLGLAYARPSFVAATVPRNTSFS